MKKTKIWKFFNSVKLSIVIFIFLTVFSMVGTFIPQLGKEQFYLLKYGEKLYTLLNFLDIFDVYHSFIFQSLLILLAINIVVCSLDKIKFSIRFAFKTDEFNADRIKKYSIKETFIIDEKIEAVKSRAEKIFNKFFKTKRKIVKNIDDERYIFGDKGRLSYLGVYIVHMGVLFILIGAIVGSFFGFKAFVNIKEGSETNTVYLTKTGEKKRLDFSIFCKSFSLSFYEKNGVPKEYKSELILKKNGKTLLEKAIIVNSPLRYKGINIFQSSYDFAKPHTVTLGIKSKETGVIYNKTVKFKQEIKLPEQLGVLEILNFLKSYHFSSHSLGPTFFGTITKNGKKYRIVLPVNFPKFDSMRKRDSIISVVNYDQNYITGLQVTKDPGVLFIYLGFLFMIIGCYVAFFIWHKSLCINLVPNGDKTKVLIFARAKKNKINMNLKIEKIKKAFLKL